MNKRRSPIWLIDRSKLAELVEQSDSIKELLLYFGMQSVGGNYKTLKERLAAENIDSSKFSKNRIKRIIPQASPIETFLVEDKFCNRSHLKKRLIREGLLENKCANCGLGPIWQNKPLSLQLEHKNGVNNDNRIENLCLLCPNCHSQTSTFAGKKTLTKINCSICYQLIKENKTRCCKSCYNKQPREKKVERPAKDVLLSQIEKLGYVGTGKIYGVSDNAIRKWLKSY